MFDIDVNSNAVRATENLVARLQNFQAPLAETGAYLEEKATQRFALQKDPTGKPWAPLRPSTLARKKTKAILRETPSLAPSIASNVGTSEVRVKPSEDYGIFHQTGTKKMPARVFMGFEADDPERIGQIFRDHLEGN